MQRRLYRSRTQKVVGGVCGGLAEYFNIDPALLRVGFVVLSFVNGLGIITYLAMWLVFPRAVPQEEPVHKEATSLGQAEGAGVPSQTGENEEPLFKPRPQRAYWLGIILVALGFFWLFKNANDFFFENFGLPIIQQTFLFERMASAFWPIALIVSGIVLLVIRRGK